MPPPTSRVTGRHCSQSGNMIRLSLSSLQLPNAVQRLTGCWRCDISHPPRPAECSTVQLITVARRPVSPSLYSRWLRHQLTQPSESQPRVIAIRLVTDQKRSPRSTGDLIAIKCWSRQALLGDLGLSSGKKNQKSTLKSRIFCIFANWNDFTCSVGKAFE